MQAEQTHRKNTQRWATLERASVLLKALDESRGKHPAHVAWLVGEMLATCRDGRSRSYYAQLARALPDEAIFRFLAEIRQDPTIRSRGAVFTTKVKAYLARHPALAVRMRNARGQRPWPP